MKKIIPIFLAFIVLTGTVNASTVDRAIDKNYLRIGDQNSSIKVTLTGVGVTDEEVPAWGVIETTSADVVVANSITEKSNIIQNGNTYSIVTIDGDVLEYKLTLKDGVTTPGEFILSGTFVDSMENMGVISENMNIRILTGCLPDDPVCIYDTNRESGIQRDEIITAVRDYFDRPLSLVDVLKVVRAYLGI